MFIYGAELELGKPNLQCFGYRSVGSGVPRAGTGAFGLLQRGLDRGWAED